MISIKMNAGTLAQIINMFSFSDEICGIVEGETLAFASRDSGQAVYARATTKIKNESGENGIIPFGTSEKLGSYVKNMKNAELNITFDRLIKISRVTPFKEIVLTATDSTVLKYASISMEDAMTKKFVMDPSGVIVMGKKLTGKIEFTADAYKEILSDAALLEQNIVVFQLKPAKKMLLTLKSGNQRVTSEIDAKIECEHEVNVALALRYLEYVDRAKLETLSIYLENNMPAFVVGEGKDVKAIYVVAPRIMTSQELAAHVGEVGEATVDTVENEKKEKSTVGENSDTIEE